MVPSDVSLIYTRADTSSYEIVAHTVSRKAYVTKTVDTTSYAVMVEQGEYLALYGVTRPIDSPLTPALSDPYRYDIGNQIYRYVYTGGDAEYTFE